MQLKKKLDTLQVLLTCSLVFQGTLPAKPQRGCRVILPGDIKKYLDTVLGNWLCVALFKQGCWTRWPSEMTSAWISWDLKCFSLIQFTRKVIEWYLICSDIQVVRRCDLMIIALRLYEKMNPLSSASPLKELFSFRVKQKEGQFQCVICLIRIVNKWTFITETPKKIFR